MKKALIMFAAAALIVPLFCGSASAKPGRTSITLMERVETHTDATSSRRDVSGESYAYTMLSLFRPLDKGVNGNVYAMEKYSIDDGLAVSYILGVDVSADITSKWKYGIGYSRTTNPSRNVIASGDSDRFSTSITFKPNPNEKARKKWEIKTSYNTGTDFSDGRTLNGKVSVSDKITKNTSYNVAYQFVYGLSEVNNAAGVCSVCREHFANQYYVDLTHKMSKKTRLGLGYLFLKNLYNGARSDDQSFKLSFFWTLR